MAGAKRGASCRLVFGAYRSGNEVLADGKPQQIDFAEFPRRRSSTQHMICTQNGFMGTVFLDPGFFQRPGLSVADPLLPG